MDCLRIRIDGVSSAGFGFLQFLIDLLAHFRCRVAAHRCSLGAVYLNKTTGGRQKKFLVELIKPSHYDDQGYIIQWWRGFVPSNSLSCLYGLALAVRERRA